MMAFMAFPSWEETWELGGAHVLRGHTCPQPPSTGPSSLRGLCELAPEHGSVGHAAWPWLLPGPLCAALEGNADSRPLGPDATGMAPSLVHTGTRQREEADWCLGSERPESRALRCWL